MVSLSKWGNQDETLSSGRELLAWDEVPQKLPYIFQRSARGLRIGEIATLEIGKQEAASLLRAGLAHHLAPVDRLPLTPWSLRPPIGPQVTGLERLMVVR